MTPPIPRVRHGPIDKIIWPVLLSPSVSNAIYFLSSPHLLSLITSQITSLAINQPLVLKVMWLAPKEINIISSMYSKCACVCTLYRSGREAGEHLLKASDKKQSWKKYSSKSRISSFSFTYKQGTFPFLCLYTAGHKTWQTVKSVWKYSLYLFLFSFIRQTFSWVFCLGTWVRERRKWQTDRQTEGEGVAGDEKNMRKVRDNHTSFTPSIFPPYS